MWGTSRNPTREGNWTVQRGEPKVPVPVSATSSRAWSSATRHAQRMQDCTPRGRHFRASRASRGVTRKQPCCLGRRRLPCPPPQSCCAVAVAVSRWLCSCRVGPDHHLHPKSCVVCRIVLCGMERPRRPCLCGSVQFCNKWRWVSQLAARTCATQRHRSVRQLVIVAQTSGLVGAGATGDATWCIPPPRAGSSHRLSHTGEPRIQPHNLPAPAFSSSHLQYLSYISSQWDVGGGTQRHIGARVGRDCGAFMSARAGLLVSLRRAEPQQGDGGGWLACIVHAVGGGRFWNGNGTH